jgi:hypothetical protein
MVRAKREAAKQNLGFASRPFVLCGLPVKRAKRVPDPSQHRNGQFLLQVTGHPDYGLPWGQDRFVPIFLATLAIWQQSRTIAFSSAAEMLDTFGMQQGGSQYRRLIEAFKRVFGATIFFGTDTQPHKARVDHHSRFNFMSQEIMDHSIPTDLEAAKALSCAPAALDLFTWLLYRCFVAKGEETRAAIR